MFERAKRENFKHYEYHRITAHSRITHSRTRICITHCARTQVPPPKLSEDWAWYDTSYGNDPSTESSSTVQQRRRLNSEDTTTSSRVTLDLAYTISGLILVFVLLWILRGSIRIARENLCCCCDSSNEDTRHYLELADDFMLFPNPELCVLMLGFTAVVKNIVAPFVVSSSASEHAAASVLFIFLIVRILLFER